jgi:uncharacterized protein (DUF433 family)
LLASNQLVTSVDFEPLTISVPLREEPAGVLRVDKTRVLLALVLRAYKDGASPEAIVQIYDALKLPDVYAVVSRYLSAPEPFEQYLRSCDAQAEEIRRKLERSQGTQDGLREELIARV